MHFTQDYFITEAVLSPFWYSNRYVVCSAVETTQAMTTTITHFADFVSGSVCRAFDLKRESTKNDCPSFFYEIAMLLWLFPLYSQLYYLYKMTQQINTTPLPQVAPNNSDFPFECIILVVSLSTSAFLLSICWIR